MRPYEFTADPEVSWEIVLTPEALEQAMREASDVLYLSWDVETNGLNPFTGAHVVGHAFAWRRPNGQIRAVYMPIRHRSHLGPFDVVTQMDPDKVTMAIRPVLEGPALKCGHNLQFDVNMAVVAEGINVAGMVHDTMIAAQLMNENHRNYQLQTCLERDRIKHQRGWKAFIKPDLAAQAKQLKMKLTDLRNQHGFEFVTVDRLGVYACQDATYELRLAEYQFPFNGQWKDIWDLEMELFWVCADMGQIGVPIVPQILVDLAAEQQAILDELSPRIWMLAGDEFEITNDTQVRAVLYSKLGYASRGKTKGGRGREPVDRVDDDALWSLEKHEGSEIARLLRQYNSADKVISTYTQGIIKHADQNNVVHGEIKQSGAKTGRVSMSSPNLQNVPVRTELGRRVRAAFVARSGKFRYCVDYSQLELRVLAHLSQDPLLLRVYREGLDAHATTALEAFGTADKVGGVDMRRVAKILNFGIPFGITEMGVQRNINKDLPDDVDEIDEAKAKTYLESWYGKYAGVDRYRKGLWYQARQNGGLFWNLFGRPRRVPDIAADEGWLRRAGERQVTSSMVQGSAADLVKHSMVACWKYLKAQTVCDAQMVLMIHDDMQFDVDPEGSAKVIRELIRIMESTCQSKLSVPIKVDCEYFTDHWGNKQKFGG